ncbi:hypothetical protein V8C44DRAFT_87108 [Trichoderma aethiopicum]
MDEVLLMESECAPGRRARRRSEAPTGETWRVQALPGAGILGRLGGWQRCLLPGEGGERAWSAKRAATPFGLDSTRLDSIRARAVIRKPLRFLPRQTASQSSSVVRRLAVLLCTAALRFVILVQVCRLLLGACLRFRRWRRLADKLDWRLLLLRLRGSPLSTDVRVRVQAQRRCRCKVQAQAGIQRGEREKSDRRLSPGRLGDAAVIDLGHIWRQPSWRGVRVLAAGTRSTHPA